VAVNDIIQVRLRCTLGTTEAFNVLHYVSLATVGAPIPAPVAAAQFETQLAPPLIALLSAQAAYTATIINRILPLPPTAPALSNALTAAGAVAGDAAPSQAAGIFTKQTAFAGRGFRGRTYVPFPAEADNDVMSVPIAGYVTRLGVLATAHANGLVVTSGAASESWIPIVFHKATGTYETVMSVVPRSHWATQRRRTMP